MKKINSFLVVFFVFMTASFAQNQILTVGNNGNAMNQTVLTLSNENQTIIRFDLNAVELFQVETDYGTAFLATSNNAPLMLEEGAPELFYLTTSFIIPDKGGSELEISYGSYQDFENIDIAPSKGSLSRNIDPSTVPYVKGDLYQRDGFFPSTLASLREPFIMRDVRGQSLDVYPVQYNPVTKTLRVYSEITVTVNNTKEKGVNEFTTQKRNKTIDPSFNQMYNNLFINSSTLNSRGYPTGEEGELLIICHSDWVNDMKPYVDWKRTMGRKTTIVSTTTAGSTYSAIKTYIQNYYNNSDNNLAYVLLVGDIAQISAYTYTNSSSTYSIVSDNYLGQLVGNDRYMEVLIGRISAETVAHVQTQVQRTIEYERDLNTSDTWLSVAVGLAVREPGNGHDGGEDDYVHMNNIRTRLLNYGYNPVYQEYYNNAPGTPNTSLSQITSRFDAGAGMANYCNHGSETAWTFKGGLNYTNSQVNQLQNAGKLPYIFSVACLNGRFNYSSPCFAESWMRATQSNQPTGAIATLMATISISWLPPMTAQDEFVNICMELPSPYSGTQPGIKRTFAGAAINATQKMLMVHGTSTDNTNDFDSWTVFGDPTLVIRTKTPQEMAISHTDVILLGMNDLSVTCDAEGALAALTYIENDEVVILGTATVSGGTAEINFDSSTLNPMDLTLTVTGFNKVTYSSTIALIPPSGPYIVPDNYTVVDGDLLTYISENSEISITLKNVGIEATTPLNVTITCDDDPQLTITNHTATCGSIAPDGSATVNFNVTVAHDIPDGKTFAVDVIATETSKERSWEGKMMLKAYAPNFKLEKVLVNGEEDGNLPKGSVVTLTVVVKNEGGADAYNLQGMLDAGRGYISIACEEQNQSTPTQDVLAGESLYFTFVVITDPDMPSGYVADFNLLLSAQYDITSTVPFSASNSEVANYCTPGTTSCSQNDKFTSLILTKVSDQTQLLNLNPQCVSGGYTNNTGTVLSLMPGDTLSIKVKVGYSNQTVRGWFDLNGNKEFEDTERLIHISCPNTTNEFSQTFIIPQDATPGTHRLRLRCIYNTAGPSACDQYSYGQTLDYSFIIPNLHPNVQNVEAELEEPNITVSWEAPEEKTPVGYNIYRDGNKLNSDILIDLTYTEEDVTDGVYVYNVTAVYENDKESFAEMSNVICYTASIIEPELCEPPVHVSVTAEDNGITIVWEQPENMDGELLGYYIYRDGEKINDEELLDPAVTEYRDENLEDATYVYQVSASYAHCDESDKTEGEEIIYVGINDYNTGSYNIFPNPATGQVRITSSESRITNIEIFDVYGRNVVAKLADGVVLDVSHLQAGVYFVRIYSETNDVAVKRLVVVR